jgi:hypothetical protein
MLDKTVSAAEHDSPQLCATVLEGKIPVPGSRCGKIRDFALDRHGDKISFNDVLQEFNQPTD